MGRFTCRTGSFGREENVDPHRDVPASQASKVGYVGSPLAPTQANLKLRALS